MSQITSPVILDSTGVRIAAAIEALAGGGSGGGAAGCVTDLGGTIGDGINRGSAWPSGIDPSTNEVSSMALTLQSGILYVYVSLYSMTSASGGRRFELLTFPDIVVSEDYAATSFPPVLPDPWGQTKSILHNLLNQDGETTQFYFEFKKNSNNNNIWTLYLVYTGSSTISDYPWVCGLIDLHYGSTFIDLEEI